MSELARFILLGLAAGALYALTAQGLVLIYRGTGVVNFAQGGFAALGAFIYYKSVARGWSEVVAWILAIGGPAILGALTHLIVMRRLRRASPLVRLTATLGVFFLLLAIANYFWADTVEIVQSPLPSTLHRPFGETSAITEDRLWLIGIAVVITAVLHVVFKRTLFGQATEAVSENPIAASALGHSPDQIAVINWMVGSALAAAAGIFIAPILALNVFALAFTVLRSLAAALVGNFRSFWWTLAGAFGIGVMESVLSRYVANEGVFQYVTDESGLVAGYFSAQSVSRSAAFLVIVVVLVVGGRALPLRSEVFDRLPALGTGRAPLPLVVCGIVGAAGVVLMVPDDWATALMTSFGVATICLSLVVIIGYVGQLSLAQMALAGFGVWVAGRLVGTWGWPFPLALVVSIIATMILGGVVAIPALRTRGVNLAVLTFGLAVMITELILTNSALTGGLEGIRIPPLTFFGLDIDAFDHPRRYAMVVLIAMVLAAVVVSNIRRGQIGRRLIAVRDNERAAASLGISIAEAKLFAFTVAAGIAALGGIMLAFRQRNIVLALFGGAASINVVVYTVIGSVGFVGGGLLGGQFAVGGIGSKIFDLFGWTDHVLELVSGVVLLAVLLFNPNGLAYEQVHALAKFREKRARRSADESAKASPAGPRTSTESSGSPPERQQPQEPPESPPPTTTVMGKRGTSATPLAMSGKAVDVQHLTVRFGAVTAVDDVSFTITPGEVLGLIGPNGAGKTTVIDALTGFVKASAGSRISLDGRPIEGLGAAARARAGLGRSFQSLELFEDLTVRENLLAACDEQSRRLYFTEVFRPTTGTLTPAALLAIDEFGLGSDLDRYPSALPYGRRRLVGVARIIARQPGAVLLDEPAAGLSEAESAEVGDLVRRLAHDHGLAVMLIEHDVAMVMAACDRVAVLDFGKRIALGTPAEVSADHAVRAAYLGAVEE
jgi:ABC-type branched-subunit amino acid transport system ATPase component/branched-subunit amino acid ABC-type transport system permease component